MKMIKGLIFDVDGTILDSMPIWTNVGERYLNRLGIEIDYDLASIMFEQTMLETAQYMREHHGVNKSDKEIIDDINSMVYGFYEKEAMPKKGVLAFIEEAYEKGVPMTVATSTDRPMIEAAFTRLGLQKYFKKIYTTSEMGSGKDKPEIFYQAMKTMGSDERTTYLLDDAFYSLITAHNAGIGTVGVYDLSAERDTEKIKSIVDIYIKDWTKDKPDII